MNIFVLDLNPRICAQYTCDKHVVKMILESTQMLSTACRLSGIDVGYKVTHISHPANIWVRASLSNWTWLRELVKGLHMEWQNRFGHTNHHKSFDVAIGLPLPLISDVGITPFALAMPDKYKCSDIVKSYRAYYMGEKRDIATWRNDKPYWWI